MINRCDDSTYQLADGISMSGPSVAIKGGEYTLFILNSEVEDAIPRSPGCWTFKF